MKERATLPNDPTKTMRRNAIRASIDRVRSIMRSIGIKDTSPSGIEKLAKDRIDRARTDAEE